MDRCADRPMYRRRTRSVVASAAMKTVLCFVLASLCFGLLMRDAVGNPTYEVSAPGRVTGHPFFTVLHMNESSTGEKRIRRDSPINGTSETMVIDKNSLIPAQKVINDFEKNNDCVCTPFYNCCEELEAHGYCPDAIDIRSNVDYVEQHCEVDYHVCCSSAILRPTVDVVKEKTPGEDSTFPPDLTTPAATDVTHPSPEPTGLPHATKPPYVPKCGMRNYEGVDVRIFSSEDTLRAQYAEFPWMAAVLRVDIVGRPEPVDVYVCGGALVSPRVVLSAAHCVEDYAKENSLFNLKVRLGEWDTAADTEPYPQEDFKISSIVMHPDFKRKIALNDLALLVLERPAKLSPHINTICLPDINAGFDFEGIPDCVVSGWGKDSFYGQFQNNLKMIEIPTVPKGKCEEQLRVTRLGPQFRLHPSFICAGGEGRDSCKGDGGSPLVCPDPGMPLAAREERPYVLTGLVSWGIGCANEWPGVYVNIPQLLPWLHDRMALLDPDYDLRAP